MRLSIVKKVEKLCNENKDFTSESRFNDYKEAGETFNSLINKGIIKPRGYCLSSIADYTTDYTFYKSN